jgi:hypothetical protein
MLRGVRVAFGCAGDGDVARNMSKSAPESPPLPLAFGFGNGLLLRRAERARSGEGVRGIRCGGDDARLAWKLMTGRSSSSCSDCGEGDRSATVLVSDMKDRRGTCDSLYRTYRLWYAGLDSGRR